MAIEIHGLSKKYGYAYALRNIALKVVHGEVFGLLGPNGSGKTTLLKVLATLTSPTYGNVREYGLDLNENGRELRQMIGYLAHEPLLYRDLSGEENIRFYSKFYKSSSSDKFQGSLEKALNLLKIARYQHEPVKTLSSGLRKRFDLARAIIHDPMILLLDEPFSGLDMESVAILQDFITSVREKKTVVLSTHDLNQAKRVCSRVALLVEGKLCQVLNGQDITDVGVKQVFDGGTLLGR
jgi:ABC-type multidrug transport system ATPase subunit